MSFVRKLRDRMPGWAIVTVTITVLVNGDDPFRRSPEIPPEQRLALRRRRVGRETGQEVSNGGRAERMYVGACPMLLEVTAR